MNITINKSDYNNIRKIVFSLPIKGMKDADGKEVSKAQVRAVCIKNERLWQLERFSANQAFHTNIEYEALQQTVDGLAVLFKEVNVLMENKTISYKQSKKGKLLINESPAKDKKNQHRQNQSEQNRNQQEQGEQSKDLSHNRTKSYLLEENTEIPPLVDLGVFDQNYKIIKSKFDKYKQINRFVELIDHELKNTELAKPSSRNAPKNFFPTKSPSKKLSSTDSDESFTILDFGCGKSYLTFVLYHYFVKVKNKKVHIIGYDLKQEVVAHCNAVAQKYGYEGLRFVVGDVSDESQFQSLQADMVITLHACDTATDYALYYAIKHQVSYLFSVPCCQHELNAQLKDDGNTAILLRHGLIKERFAALLTDSIRCEVLSLLGYQVDVIEFVDFAHSPKNLMIRAVKQRKPVPDVQEKLLQLNTKYSISHTLVNLLCCHH